MEDNDTDVLLSYDSFVENYSQSSEDDLKSYLDEVIDDELNNDTSEEISATDTANHPDDEYTLEADDIDSDQAALEDAYQVLTETHPELDMSYDDFVNEYELLNEPDVDTYLNSYDDVLVTPLASPDPNAWYYNTGTSLPRRATYSNYGLLHSAKKGDLIYEGNGGFGITGHIAMVEGIFYSTTYDQFYIRLIEATSKGVCRGVLDDTRVDDKDVSLLSVKASSGVTEKIKNSAVAFCISQLGKDYRLDLAHDTSASEMDWYCSELVWAAYKRQGIDLEVIPWPYENESGITPHDLLHSEHVSRVYFKDAKISFGDIGSHWAKPQIHYVARNGLMNGITTTEFGPDTTLSRAMAITVLYRLAGTPTNAGSEPFSDVSNADWYSVAVSWAYSNGIVSGVTSTTFCPNNAVTREQLVTMLYRYAQYKGLSTSYSNSLSAFTDAGSISSYAVVPMKWAVSKGILAGTTSTTLSPQETCTRAQYAVFIYRVITKLM